MFKSRAIFLDRDGVLIKTLKSKNKPIPINKFNKIRILKTTRFFLDKVKKNFLLIMITNQPDVSRGKISKAFVNKTNSYLKKKLGLDDIFVCFHDDKDHCQCRKPKAGMILEAKKKMGYKFKRKFSYRGQRKRYPGGKESRM